MEDTEILNEVQTRVGERVQAIATAIGAAGIPQDDWTYTALQVLVLNRVTMHLLHVAVQEKDRAEGEQRTNTILDHLAAEAKGNRFEA